MSWTFKPHGKEKIRNPLADEFFTDPELSSNATALVREAVQNTLDARLDNGLPARIRIKVGKVSDKSYVAQYFEGLEDHTTVSLGSTAQIPDSFNYLVYEDFNTTGLWGDSGVLKASSNLEKEEQSYTYFVHVEGEGSKGEGKKGKWGVGKIVFPMLSQVKSYFAYSVRDPEKEPCGKNQVLIGQSILKYHDIGDITYQADGWMAEMVDDVPQPFSGSYATEFAQKWSVSRADDENGLSLVVPVIREGLGISELRDAVIRQYFISILSGDLECTFEDADGHSIELNQGNFVQFLDNIKALNQGSKRDLTTEQVRAGITAFSDAVEVGDVLDVEITRNGAAQVLGDIPGHIIEQAAESLDSVNVAIFKVMIDVPVPKSISFIKDSFEVLLAPLAGKNPIVFSREGILVPGTQAVNVKDFLVVVMVDEGPLADLLGWAEGPAHEDWRPDTQLLKQNFHHSSKSRSAVENVIKLVRNYPKRIVEEINRTKSEERDDQYFSDWFAFVEPKGSKSKPKQEKPKPPEPPAERGTNQEVLVSIEKGVLKISNGASVVGEKDEIFLKLAYSVSRGNAFSKWDPLDFVLEGQGSLVMEYAGVSEVRVLKNTIRFVIDNPDAWSLKVKGFKPYRDVEVNSRIFRSSEQKG